MMEWYKIEAALPNGEFVMQVKVDGKKLCLVRHQEELFALQNSCPHAGGTLSGGWCKDGHLVCPVHRWEYDLRNGRGAIGQGDYANTYPVEQRDDGVYVGIRKGFWKSLFS